MREYLRKKFIKYIINDVYNTVTVDDILRIVDNKWEWKGKELSDESIATLQAQAKQFSQSTLWKILKAELEWLAIKTLLEKGKDSEDIRASQLLGYLTRVVDEKLLKMSNWK